MLSQDQRHCGAGGSCRRWVLHPHPTPVGGSMLVQS